MAWGFMVFLLLSTPFHYATVYGLSPAPSSAAATVPPAAAIKAGYWPSWNNQTFPSSSIDFSYFTHVFYAFVQPDPTTFELVITSDDDTMIPNFTANLHAQHPPVKALLTVGGGASPPATFAALVSTPSTRSAFINSSIAVARKYGLDGLDLDWEFPEDPDQMSALGKLVSEWREAVDRETGRPRLLLASAVYFASHFFLKGVPRSYPAAAMSRGLDWVNAMCFDYHGKWNLSETGEHAALRDPGGNLSTSYGVESWIAAGMKPEKVVVGIPLYGRTWRLRDPKEHGVGAPASGVGPGDSEGVMVYSAVVEFNAASNATVVKDGATGSAYSYAGTNWVGYEDPDTVAAKIEFARGLALGGYFFWALGDDYDWSISKRASVAWGS